MHKSLPNKSVWQAIYPFSSCNGDNSEKARMQAGRKAISLPFSLFIRWEILFSDDVYVGEKRSGGLLKKIMGQDHSKSSISYLGSFPGREKKSNTPSLISKRRNWARKNGQPKKITCPDFHCSQSKTCKNIQKRYGENNCFVKKSAA